MTPLIRPLHPSLLTLALAGLLLAGCTPADEAHSAKPVEIEPSTSCSLDGMLLADYPGPKAQIHYADQQEPAFFCDTMELFSTLLAGEQARKVKAVYVQDMARASWDEPQGHWIDAKAAFYVLGSKLHGSMGPTLASFAQEDAAKAFIAKHGGRLLRFADVTPEMVDLSGGALHDSRM